MLPDLTPAVTRSLDSARRLAAARAAVEVAPLHLLLALLEDEDGRAFALASAAGLERREYDRWLEKSSSELPPAALSLSGATQRLLRGSRRVAQELGGDSTVTSESILMSVVRDHDELRDELTRRGLDALRLEAALVGDVLPMPTLEEPLRLVEPTERTDAARILDASANRAREGLRVVEDYCRFALDDAVLCEELKAIRHDLREALEDLAPRSLIQARDTEADVGTSIGTTSEGQRASLSEVVQASLKRIQESMRSLEEYGKVISPRAAERVEQLRYRAYTIEKAIVIGSHSRESLANARLYVLLTGATCSASLEWTIAEAAEGGASIVQLREKELSDGELLQRARNVRQWTRKAGVLFIVNDRPDIARLVEADGVHLGQDDMSVKDARRILGPGPLIGVSTHTVEQVRRAVLDGASYIGVGPCFSSRTKSFPRLAGLAFVKAAMQETTLPAFAIGGIDATTIGEAIDAGAKRVAVSAAIAQSDDPQAKARGLMAMLRTVQ